ncbi:3-phosphoshikimate 1-carboxyvinyltransferase [Bacillus lacus]|uniref:3-phosphoshikimate 1-carboxyvinyltransferase n=1 Tax=Metabacillus lacus TaxID=1983721 RepID=A0A7X2LXR0_9BACI|nr:3-phosphoshikimate 1-carboxyvinyltransferase [Metabacillus lacus]MRX70988.1 3-phosphoshikimate 1-carboxyvinyltransferase [Metabacillus lacus]
MKLKKAASLKGIIRIPGDKSISHRAVMFGSIAEGITSITNFLPGADCLSTISCFQKLGVEIERKGTNVTVKGIGLKGLAPAEETLDVGNSGTTIRLIMGILAGTSFESNLAGDESISKRPMSRVTKPLTEMGASIVGRENGNYTPLTISGGHLKGIEYKSEVASAQVKSAILLAGLSGEGMTTVEEPHKSRDHTERMLRAFGVEVEEEKTTASIRGGQTLTAADINVPGDISSAAFFLAAGAIVPDSSITLQNVGVNPTRTGVLDVLKAMGAEISMGNMSSSAEPAADISIKTSNLKGTTISGELIPRLIDEIPILALLATQAEGTTIIKDAEELKVKETNRITTVVEELSKLGADIKATADGMIIAGRTPLKGGCKVSSHGDHRIGMMLAVAGLMTEEELELEGSDAISVSYPSFFDHLAELSASSEL